MSQSVKLSDGSYIDAGAVWDNTQGSDIESLHNQMSEVHTYGPYTYSGATLYGWSADTEHTITLPKGTYIIRADAFVTKQTDGGSMGFKLMPMNEVVQYSPTRVSDTPWWRGGYVGFYRATEDTDVTFNVIFQGAEVCPVEYTISYIKLAN